MKKLILIFIIITAFVSCNKQDEKIEILSNNDEIYLTESEVDLPAQLLNEQENSKFNDELKKVILGINGDISKKIFYPIAYRIYINKDGSIEKIMDLKDYIVGFIKTKYIEKDSSLTNNNIFADQKLITIKILPIFEGIKFVPAKLNGKAVPYRTDIKTFAVVNEKGEINLEFDWDFSWDYSMNLNFNNINKIDKDEYFVAVEQMPSPIGGIKAIQEKIKYPEIAKRAGIEGRVYVKAYINEKGMVTAAEVLKGIGAGCDQAAINAVVNTKFEPGRQRGKPVKVQVSVPILFKLQ